MSRRGRTEGGGDSKRHNQADSRAQHGHTMFVGISMQNE